MSWISNEAEKIASARHERDDSRRWTLHVADVIRRDLPLLFDKICAQVRADVTEFNRLQGSSDPMTIEQEDGKLSVCRRECYPHVRVDVIIDSSMSQIRTRTIREDQAFAGRSDVKGTIQAKVDQQAQISNDIEAISKSLLRPLLDAYRAVA